MSGSLALVPACRALCECRAALSACQPSQAGHAQQLHHFLRPQKYPQFLAEPCHSTGLGKGAGRSQSPPACRKWVQILRSQSPAQTLPVGRESGSARAAPGTGTKSCLPRAPLLSSVSVPSPHPLLWQHQPRICSFLTCASPSRLMRLRSTASTAPCRHPHGHICSWSGLSSGSPQILFISYPRCCWSAL